MATRTRILFVVTLVTLTSSLLLGVPTVGAATGTADDPIPIDSCTELSEPGTYVLTADIEADGTLQSSDEACLEVTAGGFFTPDEGETVTILGNGHTVSGDGVGIGIGAVDERFEARNVTVTGFETGVNTVYGFIFLHDSTVSGNEVGVRAVAEIAEEDGYASIENSTVANNGAGVVAGGFDVRGSRIVDNDGAGLNGGLDQSSVTLSVIADNGIGVVGGLESGTTDARFNYWGAADGPGSEDTNAPLADPVTGALANGSGDAVSESTQTPNVSDVRFDPYLVAPPGESTYDGHYQVDLVVGDPMPQLSEENRYSPQGRLVWFLHGQGDEVERTGSPVTLDSAADDCLDVVDWDVGDGYVTVTVAVDDGECRTELTLVAYEKPGPGFDRTTADQQVLFDLHQQTVGAGDTRTFTVKLPPVPNGSASVAPVELAPTARSTAPFIAWG